MTLPSLPTPAVRRPEVRGAARSLPDLLVEARELERSGCLPEAMERYQAVLLAAKTDAGRKFGPEAMRRLAVLHHQRGETPRARELCHESARAAAAAGSALLEAEALNTLGGIDLQTGELEAARTNFERALSLGGSSRELQARAEQNLGVLANTRGDLDAALDGYRRSLDAYRAANNEHGAAIAFHNLGLVNLDLGLWDSATRYFEQSLAIAERAGDVFLRAACALGTAKVSFARQRFDEARVAAESALSLFDQLGLRAEKSGVYRILGAIFRETGRPALAESRLRSAIELAQSVASVLNEAEATRELAVLYQAMGRNQEALLLLNRSHLLFGKLDARRDLINVNGKVIELEGTYLALVREWGQSIESSDSYTYGHCSRVAENAVAVAEALGMDALSVTTIRLGAYLHDLGKVKVPHEILNKAGPLTRDEFDVVQMHPVWGIELLEGIEFPWDLKPIIRWHHEKYDGTGYPDRLCGDEIPLAAQVVGIVDVYDALTTTRAYRPAMTHQAAVAEIEKMRAAWSTTVYDAFTRALAAGPVPLRPADPQIAGLRAAA